MLTDRILHAIRRLLRDRDGSFAIQAAVVTAMLTSTGVLAVDVGRVLVLKGQLQNLADAAASAAAVQLDGRSGAIARATAVAQQAVRLNSRLAASPADFTVTAPVFYRDWAARLTTTDDAEALAVRVTVAPVTINLLLGPLVEALWPAETVARTLRIRASAAAQNAPYVCNVPPLMVCDPSEGRDASYSLTDPANIGRQMVVKGNAYAPGNYGLVCLPDGSCGANELRDALVAVNQDQCGAARAQSTDTVTTAPGQRTGPVVTGVNVRFGTGGTGESAPNVIQYPRDPAYANGSTTAVMGNGSWNPGAYWSNRHGGTLPADLTGATRYQVYLYELGASFARNGRQTLYPVPTPLPSGFTVVAPPAPNLPRAKSNESATDPRYDGAPDGDHVDDPRRRVVKAVLLRCQELGVRGSGTYPSSGSYIEYFLTEPASQQDVLAEVVGFVTRTTSSDYHANVRLLQ